jgi:formylglycine-generating enzyme
MTATSTGYTSHQLVLGCIALICCLIQPGCATDRASRITKDPPSTIQSSSTGMQLVAVHAGTFWMGSPVGEPERADNEAQHRVTLTRPFHLGMHEVTQGEFTRVMGFNPSTVKGSDRLPVQAVTWFDAISFCNRLSKLDGIDAAYEISDARVDGVHITNAVVRWILSSTGYRLPSEAEWEFACRAGTSTAFSFGETVTSEQANFDGFTPYNGGPKGLFRNHPLEVGTFPANALGLYDMSGNVFEWVWDYYDQYPSSDQVNPTGPEHGTERVRRGGAYPSPARHMRSSVSHGVPPSFILFHHGFRVARHAAPPTNRTSAGVGLRR